MRHNAGVLTSAAQPGGTYVPGKKSSVSDTVIAVIPARYGSTRFPGKPLALIAGKPMIVRVLERVRAVRGVSRVLVATDDARIADVVRAAGGEAAMTHSDHTSGTERLAEVAERHAAPFYLNVQGDEPLVEPAALDALLAAVPELLARGDAAAGVATLATPIRNPADVEDPHVVKVVLDRAGNALYFSRAAIPHLRDGRAPEGSGTPTHLKHLGVYLYRRDVLLAFPKLPHGRLERLEQLEQLRLLENGHRIRVVETPHDSVSVDVPEDVARVEAILGKDQ
jgi:3-deoxy-manno-octulosonate cytidylyltransferase (CMP-KDO synthetase)